MTDFLAFNTRHRRLAILRFLAAVPGYTSNVSILTDMLNSDDIGIKSTRAQTTTELAWLAENGFVTLGGSADFRVATVTARGVEVAQGIASHPDVQRPSPRA